MLKSEGQIRRREDAMADRGGGSEFNRNESTIFVP
jgi:hypothetical protein